MAQYTIDPHDGGMTIRVADAGDDRSRILTAFEECRDGRCGCPTDEYEKLDAMSVTDEGDTLVLDLVAKNGLDLDSKEIDACLQFTVRTT